MSQILKSPWRFGLTLGVGVAAASGAWAQNQQGGQAGIPSGDSGNGPRLTLMFDASSAMEHTISGDLKAMLNDELCISRTLGANHQVIPAQHPQLEQGQTLVGAQRTRLNVLKEALIGSPANAVRVGCIEEDHIWRATRHTAVRHDKLAVHTRELCCVPDEVTGLCGVGQELSFCYADHGRVGVSNNEGDGHKKDCLEFGGGQEKCQLSLRPGGRTGGVLSALSSDFKFGLMVSETNPASSTINFEGLPNVVHDLDKFWDLPSYFEPEHTVDEGILTAEGPLLRYGIAAGPTGRPAAIDMQGNWIAKPTYGLRAPNIENVEDVENVENGPFIRAGEDASSNTRVLDKIEQMIPVGNSPLSAMMEAAKHAFTQNNAGGCESEALVIFTDGTETRYYGGETCQEDADCGGGQGACILQPLINGDDMLCEEGGCQQKACVYPLGFPGQSAETYLAQLPASVQVTVVGLWPQSDAARARIESLAVAAGGYPAIIEKDTSAEDAIVQIRQAVQQAALRLKPRFMTQSAPLVINPTAVGEPEGTPTRQWRVYAYSETPPGDVRAYGRITATAYGCPADAQQLSPLPGEDRSVAFHEKMGVNTNPIERLALSETKGSAFPNWNSYIVLGTQGAMMGQSGEFAPEEGAFAPPFFTWVFPYTSMRAPAQEAFRGFLGNLGSVEAENAVRNFGEMKRSSLLALAAPALGLSGEAYQEFLGDVNGDENDPNSGRPVIVATAANDYQVHLFNLINGREILTFAPLRAWETRDAESSLVMADMVNCRGVNGGEQGCPAAISKGNIRPYLVGAMYQADNLFGLDLAGIEDLGKDLEVLASGAVMERIVNSIWNVTRDHHKRLGKTVSKPALGYVQTSDKRVEAAVIVGCGEPEEQVGSKVGQCVLVLDAHSKPVAAPVNGPDYTDHVKFIRSFNPEEGLPPAEVEGFTAGFTGAVALYPGAGGGPVERAYLGDSDGGLWRLDLRSADKAQWKIERIWPVPGVPLPEPEMRCGISQAPALSMREDGGLAIVFGQDRSGEDDAARCEVVSLTDRLQINGEDSQFKVDIEDEQGRPLYRRMRLRAGERLSGPPAIFAETAFFATITEPEPNSCAPVTSRLYGVHYYDYMKDQNGDRLSYGAQEFGEAWDARPMLPRMSQQGQQLEDNAISLVLPPGTQLPGITLALTPSCQADGAPTMDILLNVAQSAQGEYTAQSKASQKIEYVTQEGSFQQKAYDGEIFADGSGQEMRICLNCDQAGNALQVGGLRVAPFPSEVFYWGTDFGN